jgi:hypothetical protein
VQGNYCGVTEALPQQLSGQNEEKIRLLSQRSRAVAQHMKTKAHEYGTELLPAHPRLYGCSDIINVTLCFTS